jgi:pimeloyl-ACP methyl ester carboxylesterase
MEAVMGRRDAPALSHEAPSDPSLSEHAVTPRRFRRRRLVAVVALAVLVVTSLHGLGTAETPAPVEAPQLVVVQPQIEASEQFAWAVPLMFVNSTSRGLYMDSLACEIEDLGLGETRGSRKTTLALDRFLGMVSSISSGDTGNVSCFLPAIAESARLTFRAQGHSAQGKTWVFTAIAEAAPGPVSREHPSEFLDAGGRRIEVVYYPARGDSGTTAGLLLVHGHANQARGMLVQAQRLSALGFSVMLVSQPGYGQSTGPADFMGPATVKALEAALDRLEQMARVDRSRIAVWGISRGATAAALLAERRPEVRALVVQSGIYDLWAAYRGTRLPGFRETIVQEAGTDSAGWRARSPVLESGALKAAVLVMHGEADDRAPVDQAKGFVQALQSHGLEAESKFLPAVGHVLPPVAQQTAEAFLGRTLRR